MSTKRAYAADPHPDFEVEPEPFDGEVFEASLSADESTLTHRGFSSDFCGAWLSLWQVIAEEYAPTVEAARAEPAGQLIEAARTSYMALIHAAAQDTSKSQTRRFECGAGFLWAYRSGAVVPPPAEKGTPAYDERQRVLKNYARYWRGAEGWRPVYQFQKATHLGFFLRDARDFRDNTQAGQPACYTDRLTDLLGEIVGRKRSYRGRGLSRPAKFTRAAREALENFKRRYAPFAPFAEPAEPTGQKPAAEQGPVKVPTSRKVAGLADALIEAALARAEVGQLTHRELDALLDKLAPLVRLADRGDLPTSSEEGAVTEADFETAVGESSSPSPFPEDVDFAGESEQTGERPADSHIRRDAPEIDPASVTLDAFLEAFRPDPSEPLRLRAFKPKGAPDEPRFDARKIPANRRALAEGGGLVKLLREINKANGVYFVVNQGGDCAQDITCVTAFFAEIDDLPMPEQHAKLDACPLPPNVRVETRKSVHAYWLAAPGCSIEEWREVQRRLIHYFGSDRKIKDPSRVMRLPGFDHVSYTAGLLDFKPVTLAAFDPSRRFTAADLRDAFPAAPAARGPARALDIRRQPAADLDEHKRQLGERITAHPSARRNGAGKIDCQGICHNGRGASGLFYDPRENFVWCNAATPCDLATISRAFGLDMPTPTAPAPRIDDGRVRGTL